MLFAGATKKDDRKEKVHEKDNKTKQIEDRIEIQERAFRKWVNWILEKDDAHASVTDILNDFRDGLLLIRLIEIISGCTLPRERGKLRVHVLTNIGTALHFLSEQKVSIVNVNAADVADGNPKIILGLVWHIIQYYWKLYASNNMPRLKDMKLQDVLKRWCIYASQGYEDEVLIRDFTSCWRDGFAFNAILHFHRPDLFEFEEIREMRAEERINRAFALCESLLGVPRILEPKDFTSEHLDHKSVMTYLLAMFQALPLEDPSVLFDPSETETDERTKTIIAQESLPIDSLESIPCPPSQSSDNGIQGQQTEVRSRKSSSSSQKSGKQKMKKHSMTEMYKEYQCCLEEVLIWLLEAEEQLQSMLPVCEADVEIVKRQFKEHEDFMLSLTQSQDSVGRVLHRGQMLAQSGRLNDEEKNTIQNQMGLVNERWESVRQGAMDRQTKLQERLMYLQQTQLEAMHGWLTDVELKMANTPALPVSSDQARSQLAAHTELQERIERQQQVIYRLSSFVAVVDENQQSSEQNYEALEQSLQVIGKRWMAICQWAEDCAEKLDGLVERLEAFEEEEKHLDAWLAVKESELTSLRSVDHLDTTQRICDQVQQVERIESDLEAEHGRLINLSQLTSELIGRFDGHSQVSCKHLSRQLNTITQRWDNLVSRIEHYSQMHIEIIEPVDVVDDKEASEVDVMQSTPEDQLVVGRKRNDDYDDGDMKKEEGEQLELADDTSRGVATSDQRLHWAHLNDLLVLIEATDDTSNDNINTVIESGLKEEVAWLIGQKEEISFGVDEWLSRFESRLEQTQQLWAFLLRLNAVDLSIDSLYEWADTVQHNGRVLTLCQEKVDEIKDCETKVEQVEREWQTLTLHTVSARYDRFAVRWRTITAALHLLSSPVCHTDQTAVNQVIQSLQEWLSGTERLITNPQLYQLTDLAATVVKLNKIKELDEQWKVQEDSLSFLNSIIKDPDTSSELSVDQMESMQQRWSVLGPAIETSLQQLESCLNEIKSWEHSVTEINAKLDEIDHVLRDENLSANELSKFAEKCQQTVKIRDGIKLLEPKVEQLKDMCNELQLKMSADYSDTCSDIVATVCERFANLKRLANDEKEALQRSLNELCTDVSAILIQVEVEQEQPLRANSDTELQALIDRNKQLKEDVNNRINAIESNSGWKLMTSLLDKSEEDFSQNVDNLLTRCKEAKILIDERLQKLNNASMDWLHFQELIDMEMTMQNDLEVKLNETAIWAADAEEFSEQLDNVERLMDDGQNMEQLKSFADKLVAEDIVSSAVVCQMQMLGLHRDQLMPIARERQEQLRLGVQQSQQFDQSLLNCQSWINHIAFILSTRRHADILASDVPEEYKQLQLEFDDYARCLGEMTKYIENLRNKSGSQVVKRLQEQLDHVQNQYGDVKEKFSDFKRPLDLEARIKKVCRALNDVEDRVLELNDKWPATVETASQLINQSNEVDVTLRDLDKEMWSICRAGERLAEEGVIEDEWAFRNSLDDIARRQLLLLQRSEQKTNTLTDGRDCLLGLNSEIEKLRSCLSHLETKIESGQADHQHQAVFVELKQEVADEVSGWGRLNELLDRWHSITSSAGAALLVQTDIDALRKRWKSLNNKLDKYDQNLKNVRQDDQSLLLNIESLKDDICQWLEKCQFNVEQIGSAVLDHGDTPTHRLTNQLDALESDATNFRPRIDRFLEKTNELKDRPSDISLDVRSMASSVESKWKALLQTIQDIRAQLLTEEESVPKMSLDVVSRASEETTLSFKSLSPSSQYDSTKLLSAAASSPKVIKGDASDSPELGRSNRCISPSVTSSIDRLRMAYAGIEVNLDFNTFPATSVLNWQNRVQEAKMAFDDNKAELDDVLERGRRLAKSGPMELDVQNILDIIDEMSSLAEQLRVSIEREQMLLVPVLAGQDALLQDIQSLDQVLKTLNSRNVNDPEIARATQDALLERQAQLECLRQKATEIESQVPGKDTAENKLGTEALSETERAMAELEMTKERLECRLAAAQSRTEQDTLSSSVLTLNLEVDDSGAETVVHSPSTRKPVASVCSNVDKQRRSHLQAQAASMHAVSRSVETVQSVTQLEASLKDVHERLVADQMRHAGGYANFSQQEDTLNALKVELDAVEDVLEEAEKDVKRLKDETVSELDERRLNLLISSARTRLHCLRQLHAQRFQAYQNRLSLWQLFQRNLHELSSFVHSLESKLSQCKESNESIDLNDMERTQVEMERRCAEKLQLLRQCKSEACQVVPTLDGAEGAMVTGKLDAMDGRWEALVSRLADRRDTLDARRADESSLRDQLNQLHLWCDEVDTDLVTTVDPSNIPLLSDLHARLVKHQQDSTERLGRLRALEEAKDHYVNLRFVAASSKHKMRRDVSELGRRVTKLKAELDSKKVDLERKRERCGQFWSLVKELEEWTTTMRSHLEEYHSAVIYTPTKLDMDSLDADIAQYKHSIHTLATLFAQMNDAHNRQLPVETHNRMERIMNDWTTIEELYGALHSSPVSSVTGSLNEMEPERVEEKIENKARHKEYVQDIRDQWQSAVVSHDMATDSYDLDRHGREQMTVLVQLGHWLTDMQKEAGQAVDMIDDRAIREAIRIQQNFLDQLKTRQLDLIEILESASSAQVQNRAEIISSDWERTMSSSIRRKKQLSSMIEDAHLWEREKATVELWLTEGKRLTVQGPKVTECSLQDLNKQLLAIEAFVTTLDEYKDKMNQLNQRSNNMLDTYQHDEGSHLSQQTSHINTEWTKFNDNLRIRRAVVEAALRSRKDFHTALGEFEEWLDRIDGQARKLDHDSNNTQLVKDSLKRADWMQVEKAIRTEVEAYDDVLKSLDHMGTKLSQNLEECGPEKQQLLARLEAVNQKWAALVEMDNAVRHRLDSAQEEWEKLTENLRNLIYWTSSQQSDLLDQQPIGGDLVRIQSQNAFVKKLQSEIALKEKDVNETIKGAHSFLMQQDLRPHLHVNSPLFDEPKTEDAGAMQQRRIAQRIKCDCETLDEKYKLLKEQIDGWNRIVTDIHSKMLLFDNAVQECEVQMTKMDNMRRGWINVENVKLDDLPNQTSAAQALKDEVGAVRTYVDAMNDWANRLMADNVRLSAESERTLETVNGRYKRLQTTVALRLNALRTALTHFGPASQHFLLDSVLYPWQRAVSSNSVPYFINHDSQQTQWDHPKMNAIMIQLCSFNEVKFSAYRTAIKLRALQKRLCLDLVELKQLAEQFERQKLASDAVDVSEMVMTLLPVFETCQMVYPQLIPSLPLAIDLCINFLLNVFDPLRNGNIRTLSFKVALVALCRAQLEDKYKYFFQQVAASDGMDQKKLALLLYDLIHIPKLLGEVAAFGGSNVEPSVRSCFERVKYSPEITLKQFLNWLKCEPQSLVWLPVMHRVAAAETAKHQAKCNVCKMFPIIGLRYRCLRCFNFDACQNCFFSQRTAKSHKLTHPMQEYCVATTSAEDMRDFGLLFKNKFKWRPQLRRGYLPVQTVQEGVPMQVLSTTPSNPLTDQLHCRLEAFAQTLAQVNKRERCSPDDQEETINAFEQSSVTVRSPAQILSQIDNMQKEEFDQILRQLEQENRQLQEEYERLRGMSLQGATSTPQLAASDGRMGQRMASEQDLWTEARQLRQHRQRLEERGRLLQEQNGQLKAQLDRLSTLVAARPSLPPPVLLSEESCGEQYEENAMQRLMSTAEDVGRAMGYLVTTVTSDDDLSLSDDQT